MVYIIDVMNAKSLTWKLVWEYFTVLIASMISVKNVWRS